MQVIKQFLSAYALPANLLYPTELPISATCFTRIFTGNLTELVLDVLDAHDEIYLTECIIAKETWVVKKGLAILSVNLYVDTPKMDLQFLQPKLLSLSLLYHKSSFTTCNELKNKSN